MSQDDNKPFYANIYVRGEGHAFQGQSFMGGLPFVGVETKTPASEIRNALTEVISRCVKDGVAPGHIAYDIEQALLIQFSIDLIKVLEAKREIEQPPVATPQDILDAAVEGMRSRLGPRMGLYVDTITGPEVSPNLGFSVDAGTDKAASYVITLEKYNHEPTPRT